MMLSLQQVHAQHDNKNNKIKTEKLKYRIKTQNKIWLTQLQKRLTQLQKQNHVPLVQHFHSWNISHHNTKHINKHVSKKVYCSIVSSSRTSNSKNFQSIEKSSHDNLTIEYYIAIKRNKITTCIFTWNDSDGLFKNKS